MPRVFFSSNGAHHFEQFLFVLSFKKYVFKNFFFLNDLYYVKSSTVCCCLKVVNGSIDSMNMCCIHWGQPFRIRCPFIASLSVSAEEAPGAMALFRVGWFVGLLRACVHREAFPLWSSQLSSKHTKSYVKLIQFPTKWIIFVGKFSFSFGRACA